MRNLTALSLPTAEAAAARDFCILAKCILAGGIGSGARDAAERLNAPDRVRAILKSPVASMSLSDPETAPLADLAVLIGAFVESLRRNSAFYRLLDDGFRRAPVRTRLNVISAGATAFTVGQGAAKPVSRITLARPEMTELKAAALVVMTKELAENTSGASQALFARELRTAVASEVDAQFLASLTATANTFASSGTTAAAMRADLFTLLDAVDSTDQSRLAWVFGKTAAKRAALVDDGGRGQMSPTGGSFLNLPAMVSDQIDENSLILIDANQFLADSRTITLKLARHASIAMDDAPTMTSDSPTGTSVVSLFQTNSVALLAEAFFAFEAISASSVAAAELTNIAWI